MNSKDWEAELHMELECQPKMSKGWKIDWFPYWIFSDSSKQTKTEDKDV